MHTRQIYVHWGPASPNIGAAKLTSHALRELQAVTDHDATQQRDPSAWCWADQISDALLALNHVIAAATPPRRTVHSGRKHRALARRFSRRLADYLTFVRNPDVPLTNNGAEHKRPMAKIRQKVSGTMRTLTGAHDRQAPQLHQTTAKHGHPILNSLPAGTPGYPATPDQLRAGVPSDMANVTLVWPKTLYALTYE